MMEGLMKLEKIQRVIELMQSHSIIDSSNLNPHSHRFLANFTLFLIQPCDELGVDAKCHLISEHIVKFSASFLKETTEWIGEEGEEHMRNDIPLHSDDKADLDLLQNDFQDAAMVGLDAMQRGNSTLEDFCRSYFMFHQMDIHQPLSIFRYLPILSFTESYIYQLDRLNEKLLQLPIHGVPAWVRRCDVESKMLNNEPLRPLFVLLERQGLLTDRIREELSSGAEYWALERKLCNRSEINVGDVMRAIHLKSFDYRVLNLLLYELRGEKVNELHMEFLSVSEFLVEEHVVNTLLLTDENIIHRLDYEDDVLENNFNILRMFARIYGASTAPMMLAKVISEAEEKYESLLISLDPELSLNYQKRCEEATKEGGKISGPSLGTWNLPSIIEDEESYRCGISSTKPST